MSLTLKEYERLATQAHVQASIRRGQIFAKGTYKEFVEQLYLDMDEIIFDMQTSPELRHTDSEDRLSSDILQALRLFGYVAYPDGKTGGHVDMTVKAAKYSWIGEAKKDGNFTEGLKQLVTRYKTASGNFKHDQAGLVFYMCKSPDASKLMGSWSSKLKALKCAPKQCTNNALAYFSTHKVLGPGTPLQVRTMGVSLYHKPQDKSAVNSAKKKAAKVALSTPTSPSKKQGPASTNAKATTPRRNPKPLGGTSSARAKPAAAVPKRRP